MFSDCRVKDILASAAAEKGEQTAENDIDGGDELSGREDELMGEKVFDGQSVVVLARLAAIRRTPTKKGDLMAMLTVEDATGSVEGVCFPDYWKKVSLLTKDSTPETCFFVAGQVDFSRDNPQIKVFDLITPEEVFPRLADYVILDLANCARERQREKISRLKSLLEKMRGDTKVALRIDTDEYTVDILLPSDMNICASSDNYRLLKGEFGEQRVLVKSKGFKAPRRRSGNGKGRFRNGRSS
ncbi:MAG: hypothetical protein U5N86_10955 [Planctomycetota bacterium]|nr:hypothetical protein [Planctomycetota bacterium]